jgi:hypothetical protein
MKEDVRSEVIRLWFGWTSSVEVRAGVTERPRPGNDGDSFLIDAMHMV